MSKRLVAMCLGPEAGGGFDVREVARRSPAPDEIEIAVEAASVNPIDVRRAEGYGRRLLSLCCEPTVNARSNCLNISVLLRAPKGRGDQKR
jgi:hypothetical protein